MSAPQTADRARTAMVSAPAFPPRYALRLAIVLQTLISAGDGLAMVALASRVYQGSHASWAVAAVFLAVSVPITALAPLAGLLLDRLRPRPVLVAAALIEALVAALITQAERTGPVLALAIGFGLCAAVLQPGLGAIVPQLTTPARITKANGYLQAATWGGFTAGPLLAGVLIATGGTGAALVAVAVLYALGAVTLRALPLTVASPAPGPAGTAPGPAATAAGPATPAQDAAIATTPQRAHREPLTRQLGAGLRFLRADRESGLLVSVVGVMVAFANMAVVVEVVFAERVLRSGPTGYAILVSAWTAGMLGGTFVGGRVPQRRLAIATLAGTVAAGLGVALAGAALALWQAVVAYAFGGLANGMETVTTRSFLNHRAPASVSGRVFALYSGVLFGAASIGMAAAGGLIASIGPRLVLFVAGLGGIVAGTAGLLLYYRRGHDPRGAVNRPAIPTRDVG